MTMLAPKPDPVPTSLKLPSEGSFRDIVAATSDWAVAHTLEIGVACAIGALIYTLLAGLRAFAKRRAACMDDRTQLAHIAWRTLARTTHPFMMLVAAKLLAGYASAPTPLAQTITFLFTVVTAYQVAIWLREIIVGMMLRRAAADEDDTGTLTNAMGILKLLVSAALFTVATIVMLDNLGVNVTALVAGLGIGGIGIGLAAQNVFSDLFAAMSIIFDRPFRKGDSITYDKTQGTVEFIGLKSTRIRSITGEQRVISNNILLGKEISNMTRIYRRRGRFEFGIIYQTPVAKARDIARLCQEITEAAGHHFVRCAFVKFGPSSLDYVFDFDVMAEDFETFSNARHEIGLSLIERFNAEEISFAYPTQTSFTAAPDGSMVMPYQQAVDPNDAGACGPRAIDGAVRRDGE